MDAKSFKPGLDRELARLCTAAIANARDIDPAYVELLEAVQDTLLAGGKRLRPYLAQVAYAGLGGDDHDAFLQVAASQELFHFFLLLHDDIIDRDFTRHGRPNVAGVYRARFQKRGLPPADALHYAESFALLAGNAVCSLGLEAVATARFDDRAKLAALSCTHQMLFEVMGGELVDVDMSLSRHPPEAERLLRTCQYKTATYSFQTPLRIGAILAGSPPSVEAQLGHFGGSLGIAFQLADDLLGVYGDEVKLGKPVTSDLREGKHTMLMHYAYELATPPQAAALRRLWGDRHSGETELEDVRQILRDCGAQAKTWGLATHHLQASLAALATIPLVPSAKIELERLAQFCVNRDY